MATKSKVNGLNGVHPAGIFADMTVDGPEIGTLVVIVDRAKNLPNRKTIGKQDPYCAARLGKEAKKTETDRRGGQTPKWDQELRFTVHDSPDYYQLKVSVFNDDKKTEIIGETWVDLKEVVVSGGGQNDLWHNLSFKGKYAGEIRIEITYYDTRPKEEKPQKVRQSATNGAQDGPRETLSGPRQPKALAPVKRRPLPSDPVTGAQSSSPSAPVPAPSAIPDHVQNSPRGHRRPSVSEASAATPEPGPAPMPTAIPDHVQTPPRGYQTPSYVQEQSPLQRVEYSTPPHRLSQSQSYGQNSGRQNGYTQSPGNQHGYGASQAMVIATPPSQQISQDRYEIYDPGNSDYSSGNGGSYEEEHIDPRDHYNSRQATYDLPPPDQYGGPPSPGGPPPPPPAHGSKHVSPAPHMSSHGSYGFPSNTAITRQTSPYEPSPSDIHRQSMQPYAQPKVYEAYSPPKEDETFRRSGGYQPQQLQLRQNPYDNANNAQEQSGYHQQLQLRKNSYDGSSDAQEQPGGYQQQLQLRRNSFNAASNGQEQSGGFPQQLQLRKNSYNAGNNPQEQPGGYQQQLQLRKNSYNAGSNSQEQSLARHYSYDSNYDNHYGSMQPTVEDAPPTPSPGHYNAHRGSFSRTPQYDAGRYDQVPSPAPLNLRDRGNSASGRNSAQSSSPSHHPSTSSNGYASTVGSDLSLYRDQSSVSSFRDQSVVSSRTSYNSLPNYAPQRRQSEDQMAGSPIGYGMPQVPTSLVAGMDPDIAKEISERIYNEKRASQSAGNSPRGRYHEAPSYQQGQNRPHPLSYHEAASQPFVPAAATYDEQQSRYSTGTMGSMSNHRAVSPDTRGTVVRRGISPDPRSGRRAISPDPRGTMVRRGVSPDPRTGRRAISPNPQGTIARRGISPDPRSGTIRKSVSPAPGPSEVRRLSGVPFGPDSYDALNPALSGSTSSKSLSDRYDSNEIDPDAKIITHDGREIDPSDHIPESNYAPLRETAQPKYASQLPDRNYRPPGGSSVPASGRKQLKVAPARPSSMAATGVVFSGGIPDSAPPTGRNRLQKKTNRMSAQPPQQSSPLAPITSYQDNNYTPRGLPRANTGDFSSENYAPPHNYGGSPGYRAITSGPPAVPAKVPINQNYGGYNQGPPPQAGGGDPWALLEEMRNIDLGSGRARRRNY